MNVRLPLILLAFAACDPITSVQGRVVKSPAPGGAPAPVSGATVNVRCEGLKPDEGMTTTTDANGSFKLATAGGALPDTCTLKVTEPGAPSVSTTIGAAKAQGDDPQSRMRKVEVALPAK